MARTRYASAVALGGYLTDLGTTIPEYNFRFRLPESMVIGQAEAFAGALGFQVWQFDGEITVPNLQPICATSANIKGRKLVFQFSNGKSISGVLRSKENLVAAINAARDSLDAVFPDASVVCVNLEGEELPDVLDIVAPGRTGFTPATETLATNRYSGKFSYASDVVGGTVTLANFSIASELVDAPPSLLAAALDDCLGAPVAVRCSTQAERKARHYIATYAFDNGKGTEKKVPVKDYIPAAIVQCGARLAENLALVCLEYRGESMLRVNLVTDNQPPPPPPAP